ncbi:sensor histidine kinase [Kribbella sp. NPDC059898]|uniref:sensor histidine kinase n=1 Tax=Kribbella sp. NPDC059898 TaxID=3346995 RepID=UPI0036555110
MDTNRLLADVRAAVARAPVPAEVAMARGAPDRALDRFAAVYGVALRLGTVGLGGIAGALSLAQPASAVWFVPAVSLLAVWCLVFLSIAVRRGLTHQLVIADTLIICATLVLQEHLLSAAEIPNASGWLLPIGTAAVLLAQLRFRPGAGVPLGLLVAAADVAGQLRATDFRPGLLIGAAILIIQTVLGAATVQLVRRAGRAAESECERQAVQNRAAEVAAARRADEREHFRHLHDTALATLTMVGSGSVRSRSDVLLKRAASDAAALRALSAYHDADRTQLERLDAHLERVARAEAPEITVVLSVPPTLVRGEVVAAIAGCVGEALRNISRHAGVHEARIGAVVEDTGAVRVKVCDDGRGFDVRTLAPHRRGVRESILARMAEIGGAAEILSVPDRGTEVVLRWSGDDRRR